MKTTPNIDDTVWLYIYDRVRECRVKESVQLYSPQEELCYRLIPRDGIDDDEAFLLQARYFFYTPREAINAEIDSVNKRIKENKRELDLRRAGIKELKTKRANLQRLLEHYPK